DKSRPSPRPKAMIYLVLEQKPYVNIKKIDRKPTCCSSLHCFGLSSGKWNQTEKG
ncbi:hypothetical protein RUM43_004769, partial [Polyplax serrata]